MALSVNNNVPLISIFDSQKIATIRSGLYLMLLKLVLGMCSNKSVLLAAHHLSSQQNQMTEQTHLTYQVLLGKGFHKTNQIKNASEFTKKKFLDYQT